MQSHEHKANNIEKLCKFFESRLLELSSSTREAYHKAVSSFRNFAYSQNAHRHLPDSSLIEDWYLWMRFQGYTQKSAFHYLESLTSLYNHAVKQGVVAESKMFKEMKRKVKAEYNMENPFGITTSEFEWFVLSIIEVRRRASLPMLDLLLCAVLNPQISVMTLAKMQKVEIPTLSAVSRDIAQRCTDPKRKFVFPLDQPHHTARQLEREVEAGIGELLDKYFHGLEDASKGGGVDAKISKLRDFASLYCGASYSQLRGQGVRNTHLLRTMGRVLLGDPLCWFALRLRPGISYKHFISRMGVHSDFMRVPETFYPMEEIVRKVKKKIVTRQQPLISNIVFVRARFTELSLLMRYVGDVAWCYKTLDSGNRVYATIPDREINRLRTTIGNIPPGSEVTVGGADELHPKDRVVILDGSSKGMEGVVIGKEAGTVYRVCLHTGFAAWSMSFDVRVLEKIPEGK